LSPSDGRGAVATGSEVIGHSAERPEKALRLLRRLEPTHDALTLTRRLVRVLRSVVEPLVPPMLRVG
jgi:hypothetical protein